MTEPKTISVIVVDDHPFMRVGVSAILRAQPDMSVVGEAGSAAEAIAVYCRHTPDVAVIDLGLPDDSGLNVIRSVRARYPDARFVVLTNSEGDEDIHRALTAGALGYVVKGMAHQLLVDAVRRVARGGRYLPQPLANTLNMRNPNSNLTARELEVLEQVAKGRSNKEIGSVLGISEGTVKRHMGEILSRLEVSDRTQAVITALRRGLAHL
jgi:DNA-binding NarL/FixJ family response regulator